MDWHDSYRPRSAQWIRGSQLVGAAVKRRREHLRLSQRDVERRSGVSQSVISRLENGLLPGLTWGRFVLLVNALDGLDFGVLPTHHWIELDRAANERWRSHEMQSTGISAGDDRSPPQPYGRVR
jgi:transcriptional regulator with XRE-family HTH domain